MQRNKRKKINRKIENKQKGVKTEKIGRQEER